VKGWRLILACVVCVYLAGGCQEALAPKVSAGGVGPEFFLIVLAGLGVYCNKRGGAYLGFVAGLLQGALAGADLASFVVTRTLAGFLCAWVAGLEFEATPLLAAAVTALTTIFAQVAFMFISPPGAIVRFLFATIGCAVVNGVLAVPFHFLVKRLSDPYNR
jgi:rod shape-determining protein MreD